MSGPKMKLVTIVRKVGNYSWKGDLSKVIAKDEVDYYS